MDLVRRVLFCVLIVLSGAMASAGVAMVSIDFSHSAHCLNETHPSASDMGTEPRHDHAQHAPAHAEPGHDHETCTPHSCSALSVELSVLGEANDLMPVSLRDSDIRLRVLSVQHDLNRPPRA